MGIYITPLVFVSHHSHSYHLLIEAAIFGYIYIIGIRITKTQYPDSNSKPRMIVLAPLEDTFTDSYDSFTTFLEAFSVNRC